MAPKIGGFSAEDGKRIARAVKWAESQMRRADRPRPHKRRRATEYVPVQHVLLSQDLSSGGSANGVLMYQSINGVWSAGTADEDVVKVYAKGYSSQTPIESGKKFASGRIVIAARNPGSGLLNIVSAWGCPT